MALSTTRGSAAAIVVGPAPSAEYAVGAVDYGIKNVPTPFPNVADHVVQSPFVCLLSADFMDSLLRVPPIPSNGIKGTISHFIAAGSARLLPLGL